MYVSPFHGTDGTYELAVPTPGDELQIAVTLRTDDGEVFSASLAGTRGTHPPVARRPCRAARFPADPGPRHLAVGATAADPPAAHPSQEGVTPR